LRARARDASACSCGWDHARGAGGLRARPRFADVDSFALDEFAYVDEEAAALVPALIRNGAGDLRKVTGCCAAPARSVYRGRRSPASHRVTMMLPLSPAATAAWQRSPRVTSAAADPCWNATTFEGCSESK